MYGFLLKKNFCDGWDNLFSVVLVNIMFILSMIGIILLSSFVTTKLGDDTTNMAFYLIQTGIMFLGIFILMVFDLSYGELAVKIAQFESAKFVDFFKKIPGVLADAALFSLTITGVIFVSVYSIFFYVVQQQSLISLFIGALIFWIDIFILLSFSGLFLSAVPSTTSLASALKNALLFLWTTPPFQLLFRFTICY